MTKVAVVGGGVLGVSSAQQLARAGAEVVLVTEGELTSQASGRSLSWLNSAGIRSERYHRLRMAGIDRYRTLSAAHPGLDWLRFDGGLAWSGEDGSDDIRHQHQHELALGYDSQLLTQDQVAERIVGVDPAAVPPAGAIWRPGEGWVDLPSLVRFLAEDYLARGGTLVTGAGPVRVVTEQGRIVGVRSRRGEAYAVDAALLATGAAAPGMVAELGVTLPDASSIDLLVATAPAPHTLTAVLNTPRVSVRPRPDGGLSVDAGWASAQVTRAADGGYAVDGAVVEELLAEATRVLAGHPALVAAGYGAGPKPIPGDGEPVLGRIDEVPGLYVAFTHSGATLGLITGELLAYEIAQGVPHPMLAGYNARRFRQGYTSGMPDRDRDLEGRARQARPRDRLGRPLPYGSPGVEPVSEEPLPPVATVIAARRLLAEGRPFSAHEVYEARWKAGPAEERELWQGLAQLCVAITHAERGNRVGALRLLGRARGRLEAYAATGGPAYGLDLDAAVAWIQEREHEADGGSWLTDHPLR